MSDWQTIILDSCLEFSPYHNPEFGRTYMDIDENIVSARTHCWNRSNSSVNNIHGHLTLAVLLNSVDPRRMQCNIHPMEDKCNICHSSKWILASLYVTQSDGTTCLKPHIIPLISSVQPPHTDKRILCHRSNDTCDAACFRISQLQVNKTSDEELTQYEDFIEDLYDHVQDKIIIDNQIYSAAMNICEAHSKTEEKCHWIPNSVITKEHCGGCQPICRGWDKSLNFYQFSVGAVLYMFTLPIAEVTLPLLISDRVPEDLQVCYRSFDFFAQIHCQSNNYVTIYKRMSVHAHNDIHFLL